MTKIEFEQKLQESCEGRKYLDLIASNIRRNLVREKGYELHHIHPRGLGGENNQENLVKLTIFEHCLAHTYLAKAFPSPQTLKPIARMSSRQYLDLSELEKVSLDEIEGWASLREKAIHCSHSQEHSKHISEAKRGKPSWRRGQKTPESTRMKISAALKGRCVSGMKGKHHSEESKRKIAESNRGKHKVQYWKGISRDKETCSKISQTLKGRIFVVNELGQIKNILPEQFAEFEKQGYRRGRKFRDE